MADSQQLGVRLRQFRQAGDLSQAEVAGRARVSKAYVSQLERGLCKQPSYEVLRRIATALGLSIAELTGEPLVWDPTLTGEVPGSLRAFADSARLPEGEVAMLARIHYRGRQPSAPEDWAHLYETIRRTVR